MLHSSCKTISRISFKFGNSTHLCCSVSSHNAGAMDPTAASMGENSRCDLGKMCYRISTARKCDRSYRWMASSSR